MTPTATARKQRQRTISLDDVIDMMRAEQGDQSQRSLASALGVTPGYISDIYKGKRRPGEKVLDYFGIGVTRRYVVEYVFFMKK
jgi:transcriptional regulator with XRE-family HTH domain